MDAHLQVKTVGNVEHGVHAFPPFSRQLAGCATILLTVGGVFDGHQIEACNTGVVHGLKVEADALVAHAAIHPIPEGPRLCFFRWCRETLIPFRGVPLNGRLCICLHTQGTEHAGDDSFSHVYSKLNVTSPVCFPLAHTAWAEGPLRSVVFTLLRTAGITCMKLMPVSGKVYSSWSRPSRG